MTYLSETRDISKGNFSETIEDYRGYKIQIARYLNKKFIKDGVYTYIDDKLVCELTAPASVSIKMAEVMAYDYVDGLIRDAQDEYTK